MKGREHGCIVVKRWWSVPSTIIGNPRRYDGYPYACSVSTTYVMKGRADLSQRNLFEATQTGGWECSRHRSWDRTKAPQTVVSADGKGSQRHPSKPRAECVVSSPVRLASLGHRCNRQTSSRWRYYSLRSHS